MTNFWVSRSGAPITGNEIASFASSFPSLPDNTVANATIKSFISAEYEGEKFFQVIWSLIDGDFVGSDVKHRISINDSKNEKADRAMNMLMRIMKLSDHKQTHQNEPTNDDLARMKNKTLCIKIGNGIINGADRTWVKEVHPKGAFESSTGKTVVSTHAPHQQSDTAFNRNANAGLAVPDDEIPF